MVERKPLISGNWKMHLDHFEAVRLVQHLAARLGPEDYEAVDVSVHPPFTALRSVQVLLGTERIPIALGAQHSHWEPSGAYTGEITAPMLAKLDVRYVIVGHSERREMFGELDEMANAKVLAVEAAGMTPILCVGETLAEREAGETEAKVVRQVRHGLRDVAPGGVGRVVVAYEPIWAIGTGHSATPDDAQAVCALIRSVVAELGGDAAAAQVRVQYGGSVKAANVAELMAQPDVDGALVGGASLDPEEFARIVRRGAG